MRKEQCRCKMEIHPFPAFLLNLRFILKVTIQYSIFNLFNSIKSITSLRDLLDMELVIIHYIRHYV